MLGRLKVSEVEQKINDSRNQDMVLAYGLLPLRGNKLNACLKRYKRLQLFLKESKQFGAQKKQSEKLKASIAINNLARNYGFSDPLRFVWNMETEIIEKISEQFKPHAIGDVSVHISVDDPQSPEIVVTKDNQPLKSIPAKYNKDAYIKELKDTKKELKEQYRRIRDSFERAMVNEDNFTSEELDKLYKHPVIFSILSRLIFKSGASLGFYVTGRKMETLEGIVPAGSTDNLVIVHPHHFKENGSWIHWQRYFLNREIKQPFRQVFRELYVMTEEELNNKGFTQRFAGYQVDKKQALGVMKSRDWMLNEYNGFEKVNHKGNLCIDMYCYADWFAPSEIESPSIEKVEFNNNRTGKAVDMGLLSPVLFSETMRDIDLVVSVAYVGGVDPMLNHTTIEMRKRILEHNLGLFKITKFNFDNIHININGKYGNYSVHLGSGIIHMEGKGMIPVFPVHSQQRGHIFLPFVDEDPKTAEIISKVLMLANDFKIKDPSVLIHLK